MSAHYVSLTLCSLLMYAQYACAQEARLSVSRESAGQQMSRATGAAKEQAKEQAVTKEQAISERDAGEAQELATVGAAVGAAVGSAVPESGQSRQSDLNGPPVPSIADAQLAGRSGNAQSANGSDLYTRVTREYYSQSATAARQEKPGTLSKFGLRYSQAGSDHLWLEYRFSDKGALRLRGAAHRGVRVLAVFEYW